MTLFWLLLVFVVVMGACVGSFLNVVIYRVPAGKSIIRPPSACPECGHELAWYDNVPVLGWLWLKGKCRYCKTPISVQYPIIEAVTALLFGLLYWVYFATDLRPAFGEVPAAALGGDFPAGTWPVFVVHLFLLGSLIAATMIDAKLFIIPIRIPYVALGVALIVLTAADALGWLPWYSVAKRGIPSTEGTLFLGLTSDPLVSLSGMLNQLSVWLAWVGVGLAVLLLRLGVLKYSFADEAEYIEEPEDASVGELVGFYPHARREMGKELLFVAFPIAGYVIGALLPVFDMPTWVWVVTGLLNGALWGAALVWGTRILGTLMFGKEAMGLGDVHLMAAVGAVLGPIDTVLAFFVAPFVGLAAYLILMIVGKAKQGDDENGGVRMIPYGPFLAVGAVVVLMFRNPLLVIVGY